MKVCVHSVLDCPPERAWNLVQESAVLREVARPLARIDPAAQGGRTYDSDIVEVDAGVLTIPVWLFAGWFYRHRQMRWRRVAGRLSTQ